MPSKKKKYNARFPPARIKKIMQTDEDVGKVAAAVPVIISRALELFIETLILESKKTTQSKHAKTLSTSHIKQTILAEKQFDFLKDLVANIPDVQQGEEDEDNASSGLDSAAFEANPAPSVSIPQSKAPRTPGQRPRGRPRKTDDQKGKASKKPHTLAAPSTSHADTSESEDEAKDQNPLMHSDTDRNHDIAETSKPVASISRPWLQESSADYKQQAESPIPGPSQSENAPSDQLLAQKLFPPGDAVPNHSVDTPVHDAQVFSHRLHAEAVSRTPPPGLSMVPPNTSHHAPSACSPGIIHRKDYQPTDSACGTPPSGYPYKGDPSTALPEQTEVLDLSKPTNRAENKSTLSADTHKVPSVSIGYPHENNPQLPGSAGVATTYARMPPFSYPAVQALPSGQGHFAPRIAHPFGVGTSSSPAPPVSFAGQRYFMPGSSIPASLTPTSASHNHDDDYDT